MKQKNITLGPLAVVQSILIILKVVLFPSWSWVFVFSPLWGSVLLAVGLIALGLAVNAIVKKG